METNCRSSSVEQETESRLFQNGINKNDCPRNQIRRLDDQDRCHGRLSTCTSGGKTSEISEILHSKPSLSVQGASLGLATSLRVFTKILSPLIAHIRLQGIQIFESLTGPSPVCSESSSRPRLGGEFPEVSITSLTDNDISGINSQYQRINDFPSKRQTVENFKFSSSVLLKQNEISINP